MPSDRGLRLWSHRMWVAKIIEVSEWCNPAIRNRKGVAPPKVFWEPCDQHTPRSGGTLGVRPRRHGIRVLQWIVV
jgi:hypothetical protein